MGPYISHGIESENKVLFKTQNKIQTHGADQISKWNVTAALYEMFNGVKYGTREESKIEEIIEEEEEEQEDEEIDTQLHKRRELYKSVKCNNFNVSFISPLDIGRLE